MAAAFQVILEAEEGDNRPRLKWVNIIVSTAILHHICMQYSFAQWLSGRVLDLRPRGRRFELHRRHCVVILEQDTIILA